MSICYNITIYFYLLLIHLARPFNSKARLWVAGRKGIFRKLKKALGDESPIVWFHCASLGEFEQGRPVIESFRNKYPRHKILLTFFSPSGFEIRKNYPQADHIFYLPIDTPSNVKRFINIVRPAIAVFVKYEFWFNYIDRLHQRKIPLVIISANFREDQHFFRWFGSWFRRQLKKVDHFFVQSEASKVLLGSIGIYNVEVSGDTRFDRVAAIAESIEKIPEIEDFTGDHPVMVAGSTWPADEEVILSCMDKLETGIRLIIAPHEVHEARINRLISQLNKPFARYSEIRDAEIKEKNILIIDTIGLLSKLYQYGKIAYIGGGFGSGIHNILEAVTFGKPVIFGPNYHRFREANELIERGGAFSISDSDEMLRTTEFLLNKEKEYENISNTCKNYVFDNKGATNIILSHMEKYLT